MFEKKSLVTYSRSFYSKERTVYTSKNDDDDEFDLEVAQWKKQEREPQPVTTLYKKILESCNDTVKMGNQQDRERLVSYNATTKDESEWDTIGFVSKSNCTDNISMSNKKQGFRLTPVPKSTASRIETMNRNRYSTALNGKEKSHKRWSQNRKVNEIKDCTERKLLTKSTRTLRSLYEIEDNKLGALDTTVVDNNFNSTRCAGGVSLSEQQIHGLSPIKKQEPRTKRAKIVPLKIATLKTVEQKTPVDSSRTKVEKWLASTVDKCSNETVDHMHYINLDPIVTNLANKICPPPRLKEITSEYNKETLDGNEVTHIEEFSPIPSVYTYYVNENTLESCILATELKTNDNIVSVKNKSTKPTNNNNGSYNNRQMKKPKKKRKLICMKTTRNRKGRTTRIESPIARQPKAKSRIIGKELKIPTKVSPVSLKAKIKKDGQLTLCESFSPVYGLRSKKYKQKGISSMQTHTVRGQKESQCSDSTVYSLQSLKSMKKSKETRDVYYNVDDEVEEEEEDNEIINVSSIIENIVVNSVKSFELNTEGPEAITKCIKASVECVETTRKCAEGVEVKCVKTSAKCMETAGKHTDAFENDVEASVNGVESTEKCVKDIEKCVKVTITVVDILKNEDMVVDTEDNVRNTLSTLNNDGNNLNGDTPPNLTSWIGLTSKTGKRKLSFMPSEAPSKIDDVKDQKSNGVSSFLSSEAPSCCLLDDSTEDMGQYTSNATTFSVYSKVDRSLYLDESSLVLSDCLC